MKGAWGVARIEERRGAYRVLVGEAWRKETACMTQV